MATYTGQLPPFIFAVDTETSGCAYGNNPAEGFQVVSVGILILDSTTFEAVDSLYVEVKHDPKFGWSEGAEAVHGLSQAYLEEHGVSLAEAAAQVLNLVLKYFGTGNVIPVGHRVKFDQHFLDALFNEIDCALTWDRMIIDSSTLGAIFMGVSGSDALFDACGLPPREQHNALEDIIFTVEAIKSMRAKFMKGASDV